MLVYNLAVTFQDGCHQLSLPTPDFVTATMGAVSKGGAVAPMPGIIEKVNVSVGDKVEAGDPVIIMIAMKMEVMAIIL